MVTEKVVTKKAVKANTSSAESVIKPASAKGYLAAIRIRGDRKIDVRVKDTLIKLNLANQHRLVIVPNTPVYEGMMKMAKDYITYGEIDAEYAKEVEQKRKVVLGNGVVVKYFTLHPPRKGFERKGIKTGYNYGGVLGYRGKAIKDLIVRMMP